MSVSCHERTHAPQQFEWLFDHLVGERQQGRGHDDAERFRGLEVDDKRKLARLLNGEIKVPLLHVHGIGDALLPPHLTAGYAVAIAKAGNNDLYRQAFIDSAGHCHTNTAEAYAAISAMVERIESGRWGDTSPEGLNKRATFFGCNASNMTTPGPFVVYIPNFPYSYYSNVSTFQLEYSNAERNSIIQNSYDVATMENGTVDAMWPICVGCAILSISLERTGVEVPGACQKCLKKYCWDGAINNKTPAPYQPTLVLQTNKQNSRAHRVSSMTVIRTTFVLVTSLLIYVI